MSSVTISCAIIGRFLDVSVASCAVRRAEGTDVVGARGKQWGHGLDTGGRPRARVRQGVQCNARGNEHS